MGRPMQPGSVRRLSCMLLVAALACSSQPPPSADLAQGGGSAGLSETGGSGTVGTSGMANGGTPSSGGASGTSGGAGGTEVLGPPPDFGPNVLIFDPSMAMADIQAELDRVIGEQEDAQFGAGRYAYFFKPGTYELDVKIGYYIQALGLGQSPDDVVISGAVRSKADWFGGNATLNFWRGVENLSVVPQEDGGINVWAISQGAAFRRVHVQGPLNLSDGGWSSGGFIADSRIDQRVDSGSQQQFFVRNSELMGWQGGGWNMTFVGTTKPPPGPWPANQYTVIDSTPLVREKPYLTVDDEGHYFVFVPDPRVDTQGTSWSSGSTAGTAISTDHFYVARPERDDATAMNAALADGKHLLLTPGVYHLDQSLRVSLPGTIVFGLGLATLVSDSGAPVLDVADVDGVKIAGIVAQASTNGATTLLGIGPAGSAADHSQNPTSLHDVYCRVGGAAPGTAESCLTINSNDVIADNLWLWRADHGEGAGWYENESTNGLVVNGARVSVYALFCEHFQQYQSLWNGDAGRLYFYQSETPYDPPSQDEWQHDGVNGYASYKVSESVTSHEAWGIGVYAVLHNPVYAESAVEAPAGSGVGLHHLLTQWIGFGSGSGITHIVNGSGASVTQSSPQAKTDY